MKNIGRQSRAEIDFFAVHYSLPILRKVLAQNQFTRLVVKLVIAIVVVSPAKAFGPAHICFNIIIVGQEKIYVLFERVRKRSTQIPDLSSVEVDFNLRE